MQLCPRPVLTFFCPISTAVSTRKSSLDKYRSTFTSNFMAAEGAVAAAAAGQAVLSGAARGVTAAL